jgi:hypothetical protein
VQTPLGFRGVRELGEEPIAMVPPPARLGEQVVDLVDRGVEQTTVPPGPRLDEVPDGEVHEPGRRLAR